MSPAAPRGEAADGAGPRISVVIAFLNGADFLHEAVASVFAQTREDWELILFDDGSTDASAAYADRIVLEDPRVRLATHPGRINRGLAASRLAAAGTVQGEYLLFLDHDDLLRPDALAVLSSPLDRDPAIGAALGTVRYWAFDPALGEKDAESSFWPFAAGRIDGRALVRDLIRSDDRHPHVASTMYRTAAYRAARLLAPDYDGMYEDTAALFALLLHRDAWLIDHTVSDYRLHGASMSYRAAAQGTFHATGANADRTRFLRWVGRNLPLDLRTRGRLWRTLLRDWLVRARA